VYRFQGRKSIRRTRTLEMAKPTPVTQDRTRPSSRVQPVNLLDKTPVLMRFPQVHHHPLPTVGDFPTEVLRQSESTAPQSSPAIQPSTASQPVVQSAPAPAAQPESWWEHWSSGVVLIALIIAVVAVSIMVLKQKQHYVANRNMAGTESEFGVASELNIPSLQTSANPELAQSLLEVGSQSSQPEQTPASVTLLEPRQQSDAAQDARSLELIQFPSNSGSSNGSVPAQPVSSQLGKSPGLYDGAGNGTTGGTSSSNSVEVGGTVPDLIQSAAPGSTATTGPGTGSMTASGQSISIPALPSLPGQTGTALVADASGPSAANLIPSQQGLQNSTPASTAPALLNQPTSPSLVQPNSATVPASLVSTPLPPKTSAPAAATSGSTQAAQSTATPNMNEQAIIRAYLELSRSRTSNPPAQ
jgi:hypothetical protein